MALQGYKAAVMAESSAIAFTDEATTTSDNQTYVIADSNKAISSFNSTLIVEDGGVPTTESYTFNKLTNTVIFATVDAGRVITLTGEYVTLTTIATANSFSFNGSADANDITPFNADGFRQFRSGLVTGTIDISRFFEVDNFFISTLLNGDIKVIETYPSSTGEPIRSYGVLTSNSVDIPVDNVITESLTYQLTTEIEVLS